MNVLLDRAVSMSLAGSVLILLLTLLRPLVRERISRRWQYYIWLGAVARNKAKKRLRQAGRYLPLEEDALEIPGPDDPPRGVRAGGGAAAGAPGGGLPA